MVVGEIRLQKKIFSMRIFKAIFLVLILTLQSWVVVSGAGNDLLNAFKSGFSKESILVIPKGSRPNPSTYLKEEYITSHLAKFDNGASYLVPKSALDNYGRALIGRPDGQFVMSKLDMDNLLAKANGDLPASASILLVPTKTLNKQNYFIFVNK